MLHRGQGHVERIGSTLLVGILASTTSLLTTFALMVALRLQHGEVPRDDPWIELLLVAIAAAFTLVVPLATRWRTTRPGAAPTLVLSTFVLFVFGVLHFWGSPLVSGLGAQAFVDRWTDSVRVAAHLDWRLVVSIAPLALVLVQAKRHPLGHRLARASLGVSLVAVLLSATKIGAPPPSLYLRSLVPSVPIVNETSFRLGDADYRIATIPPATPHLNEYGARELPSCELVGPAGRLPLGRLFASDKCLLGWNPESSVFHHAPSAVYVDPRGDYAVVYQGEATGPYLNMQAFVSLREANPPTLCDACGTYGLALRVSDGKHVHLDVHTLSDRLGPPWAMTVLAAAGLSAGALLFLFSVRARGRAGKILGRLATHEGGGRVLLDGAVVQIPAAATLPIGPILLSSESAPTDGGPFRQTTFTSAVAGEQPLQRLHWLERAGALELAAIAATIAAVTPLLAAHAAGL
jgi:hypothetical protein